jgi:hypothetical protein
MTGIWDWGGDNHFHAFVEDEDQLNVLKKDGSIELKKEVDLGNGVKIMTDGGVVIDGEDIDKKLWHRPYEKTV